MESKAAEVAGIVGQTITVAPGIYKEINSLEIETIPSYNNMKPFHPKSAGWVRSQRNTG